MKDERVMMQGFITRFDFATCRSSVTGWRRSETLHQREICERRAHQAFVSSLTIFPSGIA
jgi:hypothetical protein